ncbi:MAG TPA: response regulator [Coleofasciculaceae cyanobacterium]
MCHILVVDDIEDNVFLLQTLLETEGYVVDTANSGWDALRKIKTVRPDIVLLDVMMPGMTGYEVTQRIREHPSLSDIPIILITAYSEISTHEGLAMGANDLIQKPIDLDRLLESLKALCVQQSAAKVHNHSSKAETSKAETSKAEKDAEIPS